MLGITDTLDELWLLGCLLAYSAYIVLNGGSFTLAYVAFVATGAYVAAIGATRHGLTLWTGLLIAPVLAAALALLIARPLERLSGIYLSIASVGVVGLSQVLLINLDEQTGGALGIPAIPLTVGLWHLAAAVAIVALLVRQVERSDLGRGIRMMRIDPLLAGALGVNVRRLRVWLFVGSAIVGAEAGVLRAHYFGFVTPSDYGFHLVVTLLATVIIGGVGSWIGPLLGAAIFTLLPEWLRSFGDWRDAVTGGLLLLIIIVSREGLMGAARLQWHRHRHRLARGRPARPRPAPATEAEDT